MTNESVKSTEQHLKYLDSARGIAALMVFFDHFICRNYQEKFNVHYPLLVFNGNDAVSFFFVLSGFVLSYKYIVLEKSMDVKQFFVSRAFRLFPPYFIIIVLSVLFSHRRELNFEGLTNIFIFNKTEFWEEALMLRYHNKYYYAGWTLTLEMAASFLMPFYIALAINNKKYIPYLIVVTLIIGDKINCSYMFLFGMMAATNYSAIVSDSFKLTKWYKYRVPIILASIVLFSIRHIDGISPLGPDYKTVANYLGIDFFTYTTLSCFVFLVAILHFRSVQRFLEHKVLLFLGKISYSLYLVHLVVIEVVYVYMEPYMQKHQYKLPAFLVSTAIVLTCVVISATLMHRFVELPFIRLGKQVTQRMKPSLIIKK